MRKIRDTYLNCLFSYKMAWKLSKPIFIFSIIGNVLLVNLFSYTSIIFLRLIINYITESRKETTYFNPILLIYIFALLVAEIASYSYNMYSRLLVDNWQKKSKEKVENIIIKKVSKLKMEYFETPSFYNMYKRIGSNVVGSVFSIVQTTNTFIGQISNAVIGSILLINYKLYLPFIYAIMQIPFVLLFIKLSEVQYNNNIQDIPVRRKMDFLIGFTTNRTTIQETKLLGLKEFLFAERKKLFAEFKKEKGKVTIKSAIFSEWSSIYNNTWKYIIYFIYALKVLKQIMKMGDFTLVTGTSQQLGTSIGVITSLVGSLYSTSLSIKDFREFLSYEEERSDLEGYYINRKNPLRIEFKDVSFTYPGNTNRSLSNVKFTIESGEKVVIVGNNGAGKSTIAKLILGLYSSYEGAVFINGVEQKSINNKDIYNSFTVAMQNYCKYPFTVKDNIAISDSHAKYSDKYLNDILNTCSIENMLDRLKNGFDTYLNKEYDETGTDLSEGQWHKIVLCRALYRERNNIILDEPTASLDPIAEAEFIYNIFDKVKNKTIIVISHRLSCALNADKIIVVKEGRIVEIGTHKQLMQNEGEYYNMFSIQASGYKL